MTLTRRTALGLAGALALAGRARAQTALYDLTGDDGAPVVNYRLPSELAVEGLPGIVWTGAEQPDVILVEFFDYNCPFCRTGAPELDAMLARDPELRLGVVNNAVLGLGSYQAAKVQQAVLRLHGPGPAYALHRALLSHRGSNDGTVALALAKGAGLDASAIEAAADAPTVAAVVRRQIKLAESLDFSVTPSFILGEVGMLGYPGAKALGAMVAATRACGKPRC